MRPCAAGRMMRQVVRWVAALAVVATAAIGGPAWGQDGFGAMDTTPPTAKTVDEIVQAMGQKESAFAKARDNYIFRQSVRMQTINDDNNKPDGEYQQVSDIGFTRENRRTENVVFAPANTIERVILTQQDMEDIEHRLPFILTAPELPLYDVKYLGKQKIDELETYVFEGEPKVRETGKLHYKGEVWVDQQDLQIVLVSGKSVPDDVRVGHENLSVPFTTYYEQVDGKYWFPTYTKAEGTLHFAAGNGSAGQDVHIKSVVKYTDYKQYRSSARIIVNGKDITDESTKDTEKPK